MLELVSKKYWPRILDHLAKTVRGKQVEGEIEVITPKGKRIVEYRSNPKRRGNKIVASQTILRDITERKQMEEKLRQYSEHLEELVQKRTEELSESEKKYSALVEEASDGVVIAQDGKIVFANKKVAEIASCPRDELIGLSYEKLLDEKYRELVKERYTKRMRRETVPSTYEVEATAKTGEHFPVEVSVTRINYQRLPASLVIIRDISERKRMEEQRLKLERLATIGELATMVAHDLRNPLTSIRNASFYIKDTCPHCTSAKCKTALEMVDIIEQETLSANNIINDLLDFAAKRPLQKEIQDINNIIEDSLTKGNVPKKYQSQKKVRQKSDCVRRRKATRKSILKLNKKCSAGHAKRRNTSNYNKRSKRPH